MQNDERDVVRELKLILIVVVLTIAVLTIVAVFINQVML
jgi:hypothetical protein